MRNSLLDSERLQLFLAKNSLEQVVRVLEHNLDAPSYHFNGLGTLDRLHHVTRATYLRLFLPEILDLKNGKLLYIDCDTLIDCNLRSLFDIDLQGSVVGAVIDFNAPCISSPGGLAYCWKDLGYDPKAPCFNAGILLIDVELYRMQSIGNRILEFAQRYSDKTRGADQDLLNVFLYGQWHRLPEKFNWQSCLEGSTEGPWRSQKYSFNGIRHFTGGLKPWKIGLVSRDNLRYHMQLYRSKWFTVSEFFVWLVQFYSANVSRKVRGIKRRLRVRW